MQIVDLRQINSRQLDPLLQEEAQRWEEELSWDYRPSTELIKKFVDARSLTGSALLEDGRPVGYAFYVMEEHKGLVGGLFVSPRYPQQEWSDRLLRDTLLISWMHTRLCVLGALRLLTWPLRRLAR